MVLQEEGNVAHARRQCAYRLDRALQSLVASSLPFQNATVLQGCCWICIAAAKYVILLVFPSCPFIFTLFKIGTMSAFVANYFDCLPLIVSYAFVGEVT